MPWPKKTVTNPNALKMKGGDTITIKLLEAEPHKIIVQHFTGQGYDECVGQGCEFCANKVKRSAKCFMKVVDLADQKEKVLEGTAGLFNSIREVMEMTNGGNGSSYMIKATGEKLERKYTVIPMAIQRAPVVIGAKAPEPVRGDAQDDDFRP